MVRPDLEDLAHRGGRALLAIGPLEPARRIREPALGVSARAMDIAALISSAIRCDAYWLSRSSGWWHPMGVEGCSRKYWIPAK